MVRNSLDPDSDFWLDPDSMNMDPKHCQLRINIKHQLHRDPGGQNNIFLNRIPAYRTNLEKLKIKKRHFLCLKNPTFPTQSALQSPFLFCFLTPVFGWGELSQNADPKKREKK